MAAKTLMVQGTASSVGKSVITAALCRILRQDGWNVAPFKAQNMSLNSFVTQDGLEMGRAQVVQAEAACVEPSIEMNPILLKPEGDNRSQVIVMGRPIDTLPAREYFGLKEQLWSAVTDSLGKLSAEYDVIVVEGAGSPAEVNLKDRDIVNMRVAQHLRAPVLLVSDIDRGGVFASIVGTLELLTSEERTLVKGLVINKFRGDLSLLTSGLEWIEQRTGIKVLGVIPYYHDIYIAEEDSVSLERRRDMKTQSDFVLDIAVIGLPHISNFDDFDPFEQEEGVRLRYVEANDSLGDPDLIILPGTKSTIADLQYLESWAIGEEIARLAEQGTPVIGICGGYQMLGELILDPNHVESTRSQMKGLGLLPVTTTFVPSKSTHQVRGTVTSRSGLLQSAQGLPITGYEIHMGHTNQNGLDSPFLIEERSTRPCRDQDGATSVDGNVLGTYVHGLFHNEGLRRAILKELAIRKGVSLSLTNAVFSKEEAYDRLADLVRGSLDMDYIYRIMGVRT